MWRVTTRHPDGSQTIVLVASWWRAVTLSENARPGEPVTIDSKSKERP
jgi:hypothetical protein